MLGNELGETRQNEISICQLDVFCSIKDLNLVVLEAGLIEQIEQMAQLIINLNNLFVFLALNPVLLHFLFAYSYVLQSIMLHKHSKIDIHTNTSYANSLDFSQAPSCI